MVHSNKLTLFALCVGTFVVMLDTTIMNIALPQIHTELSASFSELSWALNAYTILFAALTIPFSKLAHSTGKKRFYLGALFIFAVGPLVSGLANGILLLVVGRVLQSLGAAAIFPLSMDLAISTQDPTRRGKVTLTLGMTQGSASAFGPVLGGMILQNWGWRWIFLINIPVVLLSFVLIQKYIPNTKPSKTDSRIDWWGAGLMTAGLFCLTLFLLNLRNTGVAAESFFLLMLFILFFTLFIRQERHTPHAIVDFRLFHNKNFKLATTGTILGQILLVGYMVLMPTLFETIFHRTSLESALLVTPATVAIFVLSPFAGKAMRKIKTHLLVALGFLVMGLGYLGLAFLQAPLNYGTYIACSIFVGAGYGILVGPISMLSTADFTGSDLTVSQGVIGVLRQLGTVLATTIFISGLTTNLASAHTPLDYISSFTRLYLYASPAALIIAALFLLTSRKSVKFTKGSYEK